MLGGRWKIEKVFGGKLGAAIIGKNPCKMWLDMWTLRNCVIIGRFFTGWQVNATAFPRYLCLLKRAKQARKRRIRDSNQKAKT